MGIWDFSEYDTEDIEQAVKLYGILTEMGLNFADGDGLAELEHELQKRWSRT